MSYPAESDVRLGIVYGAANEFTGTLDLPPTTAVLETVNFDGDTKSGQFSAPVPEDVRDGLNYGAVDSQLHGTLALPDQSDVRLNVQYGTDGIEFTGTLVTAGGVALARMFTGY